LNKKEINPMIRTSIHFNSRRFVAILFFTFLAIAVSTASGDAKEITLAWDPSPDENVDHYVVYWGTESGSYTNNSPPIKGTTTYTVEGLDEDKVYYFAAKAVGSTGLESDFSNEAAIPRIESPKESCIINAENCAGYTIEGTAAASSAVEILFNASPLGSTTASEDGSWSLNVDFSSVPECLFELKAASTGAESEPVGGQHDETAPLSTITEIPNYGTDDIQIQWTASDAVSGVAGTELWYKKDAGGDWTKTDLTFDGVEGTFLFSPPMGDGIYYVAARAVDQAGNAEAAPADNGEGEVICDGTPPTSTAASQVDPDSGMVTVDWNALDDLSGVATTKLYYKQGTDGKWTDTGLSPQSGTSGTFSYSAPLADATYSFQTRSLDRAGNVEPIDPNPDNRIVLDTTPPTSTITEAPELVSGLLTAEFTIRWTASDEGSSIASTELWVKKGADGIWENSGLSPQEGESGVFAYQPALGDGMYYFATRASDSAGNVEELPAGKGETSTLVQADLLDAVMTLQILSGIDVGEVNRAADVNGDGRIGIPEAVYFLKRVAVSVPAV
jgi:hypothetical protein